MHLNALKFLDPPALLNLTLEAVQFNGSLISADIGLRHPFLGLTNFPVLMSAEFLFPTDRFRVSTIRTSRYDR